MDYSEDLDFVHFDVLGDVVCGGFGTADSVKEKALLGVHSRFPWNRDDGDVCSNRQISVVVCLSMQNKVVSDWEELFAIVAKSIMRWK